MAKAEKENLAEKYKKGEVPETWWAEFSPVLSRRRVLCFRRGIVMDLSL